jgi:hypothetical protein
MNPRDRVGQQNKIILWVFIWEKLAYLTQVSDVACVPFVTFELKQDVVMQHKCSQAVIIIKLQGQGHLVKIKVQINFFFY